jgi:hypothetical protein
MNTNQWIVISIVIITIVGSIIYYYSNSQILYRHHITTHPTNVGLDKFGINEIYSTKPGGEQWYFNTNDPNTDPRASKVGGPSTKKQRNDDGSWKVKSTEVRYGVLTSSGWHPELITTLNQNKNYQQKGICSRPTIGRM